MNRIKTGTFLFFLPLLFACHSAGQVTTAHHVHFKSGAFLPPENVSDVLKNPEKLSAARFGNHYYVVIQFYTLPDSSVRKKLSENGVRLLQYVPQLSYVSALPSNTTLHFLMDVKARSVFTLTASQKLAPQLQQKNFPAWAIPQKGYADLIVSTFEPFELFLLEQSITGLDGQVLGVQNKFGLMTIRLPQKNLAKLAQLPFVLFVEAIEEPLRPEKISEAIEQ